LHGAAHYFKLAADQGLAVGQHKSGVPIDLARAARYFKLAADQGHAIAQTAHELCLLNGKGVPIDMNGVAHYFKWAADQGDAAGQYNDGLWLGDGVGIAMDLSRYLELTADQANPDAQLIFAALLRNGIIKIRYFKFAAEQRVAEAQ
jgi:TPR repeat protein